MTENLPVQMPGLWFTYAAISSPFVVSCLAHCVIFRQLAICLSQFHNCCFKKFIRNTFLILSVSLNPMGLLSRDFFVVTKIIFNPKQTTWQPVGMLIDSEFVFSHHVIQRDVSMSESHTDTISDHLTFSFRYTFPTKLLSSSNFSYNTLLFFLRE